MKLTEEQHARLAEIALEEVGLTPTAVVEDAKDPTSPLHELFEWQNDIAAAKYRLDQARGVIRARVLVQHGATVTLSIPYYVRDPKKPSNVQGYTSILSLREDPEAARDKLIAEAARVESSLLRARQFALVLGHVDVINDLLARLKDLVIAVQPPIENDGDTPPAEPQQPSA